MFGLTPFPSRSGSTLVGGPLRARAPVVQSPNAPPFISQVAPAGWTDGYTNGRMNCGPACMAMVARFKNLRNDLSEAQLLGQLALAGGTGPEGTTMNGLCSIGQELRLPVKMEGPGPNLRWIRERLTEGKFVIAQGNATGWAGAPSDPDNGHYVLLWRSAGSNFLLRDPSEPHRTAVSDEMLVNFIESHRAGGLQLAIG